MAASIYPQRRPGFAPGLLDLYVTREMVMPFIVTLIAALVIFLGNELFWTLYNVLYLNISAVTMARWLLMSVPKFAVLAVPVATVFAVSMGTHRMARENEITAWRMAGASVLRIMAPFMAFALLLSAWVYWLNERVVPWATHEREVIMAHEIRHADPVNWIENDSVFKGGDGYIFYVEQVNHHNNTLKKILAYRPHPNQLEVILAESGRRVGRDWILTNCIIHKYDPRTGKRVGPAGPTVESKVGKFVVHSRGVPEVSFISKSNPWEMTTAELSQAIRAQESAGLRTPLVQQWRVEYHHKFSLALSALAVALVAAPLALCFARSGSFAGFLIAVTLVFFYQGVDGWFVLFIGYKALAPALVAAWATNFLYIATGLTLLARQR